MEATSIFTFTQFSMNLVAESVMLSVNFFLKSFMFYMFSLKAAPAHMHAHIRSIYF